MRSLICLGLLFSTMSGMAQNYDSQSLEKSRGRVVSYATQQEAVEGLNSRSTYLFPIDELTRRETDREIIFEFDFTPPFKWLNRQAFLCVAASPASYRVEINGEQVGVSSVGVLPYEFNVTRALGKEYNTISIVVSKDDINSHLEGWGEDRKVQKPSIYLHSQPTMAMRDVLVESNQNDGFLNTEVCIPIKSYALNRRQSRIYYELFDPYGNSMTHGNRDMALEMKGEDTLRFAVIVPDSLAWSLENPQLFTLNAKVQYQGRYLEYQSHKIGVRSIDTTADGELQLNGNSLELKVSDQNSSVGYQELKALKEAGINAVNIKAGAYDSNIFTIADSLGMLLIPTAPINTSNSGDDILIGGNASNDPKLHDCFVERVDRMYHLTKIHPSVVGFGLAEESLNGINLYESYLYMKSLGDQRPMIYLDVDGEWNSDLLKFEKVK